MSDKEIRRCRHARHPEPMVDTCAVGVDVEKLVGKFGNFGRWYRLPCHDQESADIPKCVCDRRSFFTDEEMADQLREREEWTAKAMQRFLAIGPLVEAIKKGSTTTGVDPCPVCMTGELHWSMSTYNRHVHMRCTTEDCIAFME